MTYTTANRITWAVGLLLGAALLLTATGQCSGYPPPAYAQVDPVSTVLAAAPAPTLVVAPPLTFTNPIHARAPSWLSRALAFVAPAWSVALGGIILMGAAKLVAAARCKWDRWRRGWFGTAAATLYAVLAAAGTSFALGGTVEQATAAVATVLIGGRLLAMDPATAKAPPLFPPRRATDGAGES